jgi:hypothetical protein
LAIFIMMFAPIVLAAVSAASFTSAATTGNNFVKYTHDERGTPMAHVTIDVAKMFPGAAADLSGFNLDVGYTNYNVTLFDKIAHDLANAHASPATRIAAVVSTLYGKEYRAGVSADYDEDHHRLTVMASSAEHGDLGERDAYAVWSGSNAINLSTCGNYLGCISGATCPFYVAPSQAPRSRCENQSGQNCCLSWANYNVQAFFFAQAWNLCNNGLSNSCEAHDNGAGGGGDVCFSNRATGCT